MSVAAVYPVAGIEERHPSAFHFSLPDGSGSHFEHLWQLLFCPRRGGLVPKTLPPAIPTAHPESQIPDLREQPQS